MTDQPPTDLTEARDDTISTLVAFVRALRREGVQVPANGGIVATRALAAIGLEDRARVRAALRATLVSNEGDIATFDGMFPSLWAQLGDNSTGDDQRDREWVPPEQDTAGPEPIPSQTSLASGGQDVDSEVGSDISNEAEFELERTTNNDESTESDPEDEDTSDQATTSVYSRSGASSPVRAPPSVGREDDRFGRAVDRLGGALARSRGRRFTRAEGGHSDARRALRRSVATGGAVLSVPQMGQARTVVHAVILVDVSRSVLDTIDRGFVLEFLERVSHQWRDVQVFFFDSDARDVTDAFDDPGQAGRALERAQAQWGGGTRIGHAIDTVRREHPDAVDRETTVFVVSDGLEVGEISILEDGMAWLSRRAHGVVWLNPLASSPEYEPTCRGMAASLPYVDGLFAFGGVEDLEEVARQLERRGIGGRIGFEYDPRV